MASPRFARELAQELPLWVRDGVIAQETADLLAQRHPVRAERSAGRYLSIFLGVLCALLIGGGVILLVAHNWDDFAPGVRLAFAWAPLAAAAVFGFLAVTRHSGEPAWCEPAALFLMAAAASAIAIVSQVYQCVGSLPDFLLLWLMLMILPIYVFRSTALSAVFAIAFFVLVPEYQWALGSIPPNVPTLLLALAVLPHMWRIAAGEYSGGARQLNQLAVGAVLFCLVLGNSMRGGSLVPMLGWPLLCCVLLQAGWYAAEKRGGAMNALRVLGAIGFLIMVMLGSFRDFWHEFRFRYDAAWPCWLSVGLLALVWLGLAWRFRRSPGKFYAALWPVLFLLCSQLGMAHFGFIAALLVDLYILILGAGMLVSGFRTRSQWTMNRGLAVLMILIFLRFCESDDILLRAFVFLGLGVALGVTNLVFVRKLKKKEEAAA